MAVGKRPFNKLTGNGKVTCSIPAVERRNPLQDMALRGQSLTLLLLATALLVSLNYAQHYSLEWKPGGKRDLEQELEPPSNAFECDGPECAFSRVPNTKLIRELASYLSQRNYDRKGALK
ncbi:progonadoliberin-2 isoform X3 [Petromyzon marinus]|uniref:Progonadoliberin-2-like isoform X3 n=2 Tax=Petromyzon marinus TaxID=7757 RepID=A0AAJ7T0U0_PETMA|nr:progonadoliberin-2-like isoform X3 [Petromyzon marinus]